uniref:Macro domain-containing protein n=1 Tax=Nothobranchius furzeri TaxID=105023 RepID=A0A8C6KX94_NOTFU
MHRRCLNKIKNHIKILFMSHCDHYIRSVQTFKDKGQNCGSEPSRYQRNQKLDQKISVYSGDITMLEIDAIVNAGMCALLHGVCDYVYYVFLVWE